MTVETSTGWNGWDFLYWLVSTHGEVCLGVLTFILKGLYDLAKLIITLSLRGREDADS